MCVCLCLVFCFFFLLHLSREVSHNCLSVNKRSALSVSVCVFVKERERECARDVIAGDSRVSGVWLWQVFSGVGPHPTCQQGLCSQFFLSLSPNQPSSHITHTVRSNPMPPVRSTAQSPHYYHHHQHTHPIHLTSSLQASGKHSIAPLTPWLPSGSGALTHQKLTTL